MIDLVRNQCILVTQVFLPSSLTDYDLDIDTSSKEVAARNYWDQQFKFSEEHSSNLILSQFEDSQSNSASSNLPIHETESCL